MTTDCPARLSEIVDAHTRDIVLMDRVWVIKISKKHRSPDQRLKTKVSIRIVPLHSALLAEGFLDYVDSVGDGPLFPQITLDAYGRRNGKISSPLSKWLRNVVEIQIRRSPSIRIATRRRVFCETPSRPMGIRSSKRTWNGI